MFPTVYFFCLDGYFGGCVVVIIVIVVVVFLNFFMYLCINFFFRFFIHLFIIFSAASTVILIFVVVAAIAPSAFVVGVIVAFRVCLVIGVANSMLMFSILVLLIAPYFTVNSVDK